jgi:hypothetical protein
MVDITTCRGAAGSTSGFVVAAERVEAWAEAGRATEMAYRAPVPMGLAVRVPVALAMAAMLGSAWVGSAWAGSA